MVEFYIDPEDVLSDFLRVHLTDPRARAEATSSNTLTATASQTVFIVSPPSGSVSCITSLTVAGSSKIKWTDYYWDYQNSKVTFYTGLTVGQEVIINFKYGSSNWIFSDKPNDNLKAENFPRISIFALSGVGKKLGNYQAPVHSKPRIQFDTWARTDQVFTINSRTYSNEYLGRYLGNQILNAFEDNEDELFGIFFDYDILSIPKAAPFSPEFKSYHSVVEMIFHSTKLGRIVK